MISISFAYTTNNGELFVKGFTVTSFEDTLHKIAEYIKPNVHRMVNYSCDSSNALWGRGGDIGYFQHCLQVVIHDMMNRHKEKI